MSAEESLISRRRSTTTLRRLCSAFLVASLAVIGVAALEDTTPIVVLVSLDGWRWDYIDRANTPNLRALAATGVRATGLIPSFPAKTFPNLSFAKTRSALFSVVVKSLRSWG